jgi:hypothetical protein
MSEKNKERKISSAGAQEYNGKSAKAKARKLRSGKSTKAQAREDSARERENVKAKTNKARVKLCKLETVLD